MEGWISGRLDTRANLVDDRPRLVCIVSTRLLVL